jgi:sulfoxide reductase heme-binding subunit YedZ
VPMSGSYRPLWTALGIVSFYLLIVIALSNALRRFIGQKIWRIIHITSFVLFYVILYHGLRGGTDTSTWWAQTLYVATGTVATFLFLWRFLLANLRGNELSIRNSNKAAERQSTGDAIK